MIAVSEGGRPRRAPAEADDRGRKRPARAREAAEAEALIAEVDALPADEHVKRVGDADVQAALEVSATVRMLAG